MISSPGAMPRDSQTRAGKVACRLEVSFILSMLYVTATALLVNCRVRQWRGEGSGLEGVSGGFEWFYFLTNARQHFAFRHAKLVVLLQVEPEAG